MESSTSLNRSLYKRLLTYHCYRDGKRIPSATSVYLNKVYGKHFITLPAVKRLYRIFDDDDFDFNELCKLDFMTEEEKAAEKKAERNRERLERAKFEDAETRDSTTRGDPGTSDAAAAEDTEDEPDDKRDDSEDGPSDPTYTPKLKQKMKREKKRKIPEFLSRLPPAPPLPLTEPGQENTGVPEKKNLKRRQLYLHCYEAKYSAAQAARYLNTVYGENFATKTSISGWYRKFKARDFTLNDKPRSGRRAAMKDADLDVYMRENPKSTVPKLCEHFKVHRKTMMRCLHRLCYRFVIDQWLKIEDKNEITDQMLCEHKLHHPDASVREIAEHFQINRAVVARRLRSMGFNIPKWPTWPKKKRDPTTGEWISVAKPLKPGETFIKRKATPKKAKVEAVEAPHDVHGGQTSSTTIISMGGGGHSVNSCIGQQQTQQQQPMVVPPHEHHQQQSFNSIIHLATSTAVNSILPAVLRHKTQNNNSFSNLVATSVGPGPQGPIAQPQPSVVTSSAPSGTLQNLSAAQPQQTNVIVGPITADGPSPYVQAIQSTGQQQQQQVVAVGQYGGPQQQQQQHQEPDILMQAVFDSFNPPLDNVQVQSILHPYYM